MNTLTRKIGVPDRSVAGDDRGRAAMASARPWQRAETAGSAQRAAAAVDVRGWQHRDHDNGAGRARSRGALPASPSERQPGAGLPAGLSGLPTALLRQPSYYAPTYAQPYYAQPGGTT
jgi:hypothetical protein